MSAKKYLTLEETAEALGISPKDLTALRERQEIRGFADRGTWKFKAEDVEEFQRRRQADSNPDVPMLDDRSSDDLGDQPTIIRKSVLDEEDSPRGASDSDVRLIVDPELEPESSLSPSMLDSDSDVRLIDEDAARRKKSDSDVRLGAGLSDSDSDVRLADSKVKKGSDSDVLLVAPGGSKSAGKGSLLPESDSDVKLVGKKPTDTEMDMPKMTVARAMPPKPGAPAPGTQSVLGDDDLILDDDSGLTLKAGSGIALENLVDSGISLESHDSSVLVSGDEIITGSGPLSGDSAHSLRSDSSMTLAGEDSGIALEDSSLQSDSGISILTGDSGISLESPADSGISLESHDELSGTVPMMVTSDVDRTNVEVPTFDDGESSYDLRMPGGDSEEGTDTNVILFDDEADVEDHAATMKRGRRDTDAGETFDLEEAGEDVESLDELDVADDVVGEDDELDDMDVFDAADEDFDESFSTGESHAEFVAPVRGAPAPVEQEWGGGTFAGLLFTTGVMAVCGMVMFDLVRSMWSFHEPGAVTGSVIGIVRDMF